jgi:hypothetical protein
MYLRAGPLRTPPVSVSVGKGLSRTYDTVGEFVWGVWDRVFAFPAVSILPKFLPNDPRSEFATRIIVGSGPDSSEHGRFGTAKVPACSMIL